MATASPARTIGIACLVLGLLIYVAAVAGVWFAEATPPGDVGAISTLVCFGLFGAFAFLMDRPVKSA